MILYILAKLKGGMQVGVIVGSNYVYIACNDPNGIGCRHRTLDCADQTLLRGIASRARWHCVDEKGLWYCGRCSRMTKPIRLTIDNWWNELEDSNLPRALVDMLKSLVSSTLMGVVKPRATPELIKLAKDYVTGGIYINDKRFEIFVWVPNNTDTHNLVFDLIQSYPNNILKRIGELE